jgi:Arc/MetJ-type ribon-helix-helix transcriptional regulator
MNVNLPPEVERYIEQRVRDGAFSSPSEFVTAAAQRQMQEETWFEQRVLAGLEGPVTPLTAEDLSSVRAIARNASSR